MINELPAGSSSGPNAKPVNDAATTGGGSNVTPPSALGTSTAFKYNTQGWYITFGVVVSVALANTKVGPILLGILSLGLLYQVNEMVQGK